MELKKITTTWTVGSMNGTLHSGVQAASRFFPWASDFTGSHARLSLLQLVKGSSMPRRRCPAWYYSHWVIYLDCDDVSPPSQSLLDGDGFLESMAEITRLHVWSDHITLISPECHTLVPLSSPWFNWRSSVSGLNGVLIVFKLAQL